MKKQLPIIVIILWFVIFYNNTFAQQTNCYPLTSNFDTEETLQPSLEVLSNAQNVSGNFTNISANNNLCASGNNMPLYYFEKNAGLKFNNSESFIDCAYTIEMVFKFENFPTLFDPAWLRILGFSNDDTGLFFYKVPFSNIIVFEFWKNNTQLLQCDTGIFNEQDWYKITLVRSCSGQVDVYVNCDLMCSYEDSATQLFLPKPSTGNQIIFFQDEPTTLAAEASSGWVKNIKISDFAKAPEEVEASCDCFCEELTSCEMTFNSLSFTCDSNNVGMLSDTILSECSCGCDTIFLNEVQLQISDTTIINDTTCDVEQEGVFYQNLQNSNGCDSIVITNVYLLESPYLLDSIIVADSGNGNGSILLNIAGGNTPYSYQWSNGDTTFFISELIADIYSVTVTDQNGCELLLDFEVETINGLSNLVIPKFQIFPNPILSGASFYIQLEDVKTRYLQIKIFDIFGHFVFENEITTDGRVNYLFQHSMKAGNYFLQIKNKEGRSRVEKIIVIN